MSATTAAPSATEVKAASVRRPIFIIIIIIIIIGRQRELDRDWPKSLLADIEMQGIRDVADPAKLARA
ncbi:MAG TPA: hypothetical protein VK192_14180 [Sphingomicrobium sp.]|jgi:hypothetical protein|nr:hypothetical protein [Sphingomicrobium sp.]